MANTPPKAKSVRYGLKTSKVRTVLKIKAERKKIVSNLF